ncbi:MAG TPA: DUF308 domain-containing protein [Candidatus Dormibacteraeota bacterium]|nr:DUF308 domain-containing protein [Candidatus Dormibacteraeota bacterium]
MGATSISSPTVVQGAVGWSIALSALMILAGFFAIFLPPAAGIAVTLLVGWQLVFSGGAHLVYAWHTRGAGAVL